ncbi:unnamed protein product [Prunus armeniaca]|uniref:Uncharacterized protein n=1 Tax=Prunus armeniaca TaxID=36596 RepID=A0A6J5WLC4_PRUAR|nr:unnamed protein product [Prunus armeniaca]
MGLLAHHQSWDLQRSFQKAISLPEFLGPKFFESAQTTSANVLLTNTTLNSGLERPVAQAIRIFTLTSEGSVRFPLPHEILQEYGSKMDKRNIRKRKIVKIALMSFGRWFGKEIYESEFQKLKDGWNAHRHELCVTIVYQDEIGEGCKGMFQAWSNEK